MWIRRRILTALAIAVVTACLATASHGVSCALDGQPPMSASLLRLHVIANSDTIEDQALKLKVRDAIMESASVLLDGVTSKQEAVRIITNHQDYLLSVSSEVISSHGFDHDVTLSVGRFLFPDRVYGDVKVPAGEYDAVRVTIGAGQGANWWCVIFPPLCFIDMSGMDSQAQTQPPASSVRPDREMDEKERLQAYLQDYVDCENSSSGLCRASESADVSGTDEGETGSGLMARLEGEIGKITRHFGFPKYAINTWIEFF